MIYKVTLCCLNKYIRDVFLKQFSNNFSCKFVFDGKSNCKQLHIYK